MTTIKWCNKYLLPIIFIIIFCVFGSLVYISPHLISSLVTAVMCHLSITFFCVDYLPNAKMIYSFAAAIILIIFTVLNLILRSFVAWQIGLCVNITLCFLGLYLFAVASYKHKDYIKSTTENNLNESFDELEYKKIPVNAFLGVLLLFCVSFATLFFGKTNWMWLAFYLPFFQFALYNCLKFIFRMAIYYERLNITVGRIIWNLICVVVIPVICLIFSDDAAFYEGKFSVDLIYAVLLGVLCAFPLKTAQKCAKEIYPKKKANNSTKLQTAPENGSNNLQTEIANELNIDNQANSLNEPNKPATNEDIFKNYIYRAFVWNALNLAICVFNMFYLIGFEELVNWNVLLVFLPWIIIAISSETMSRKKELNAKRVRPYSIIDFILKILACYLSQITYSKSISQDYFYLMLTAVCVLGAISFALEIIMLAKISSDKKPSEDKK